MPLWLACVLLLMSAILPLPAMAEKTYRLPLRVVPEVTVDPEDAKRLLVKITVTATAPLAQVALRWGQLTGLDAVEPAAGWQLDELANGASATFTGGLRLPLDSPADSYAEAVLLCTAQEITEQGKRFRFRPVTISHGTKPVPASGPKPLGQLPPARRLEATD